MPDRLPTSSRSSAKPSRNSPCRVRKPSNNCVSEKRGVRASGQALRSPDTGAHGGLDGQCKTQLAAERPLCTHASIIFFGPELGPYQHSLAPQRSILEHVSICSPSQFVHLHGKPYRLFFSSGSSMETHRFLYE